VRTVILGRIAPKQAIPDDEDDSADHLAVVNPRNAVGQRKIRRICATESQNRSLMSASPHAASESIHPLSRK
jgi:hypothetical protein